MKNVTGVHTVNMADFGLCQSTRLKTIFSTVGGSLHYMAPEMFSPDVKYRMSIDVFSLGALLGYMMKAAAKQDLEAAACM